MYPRGALHQRLHQTLPDIGKPATQQTEAWVFFDRDNFYVSARCFDTRPPSEWMANEMRRDIGAAQGRFRYRRRYVLRQTERLPGSTNRWPGAPNSRSRTRARSMRTTTPCGRFEQDGSKAAGRLRWRDPVQVFLRYVPAPRRYGALQMRRTIAAAMRWSWLTPLPISIGTFGNIRMSTLPTAGGSGSALRQQEPRDQAVWDVESRHGPSGQAAVSNDRSANAGFRRGDAT